MIAFAAINLRREGFLLIGLVHDAVLVECNPEDADFVAHRVGEVMQLASAALLQGEVINADIAVIEYRTIIATRS
jgi:hypothetical protein